MVYVWMIRDIFMVKDRWGLFEYWLDPNYREPSMTLANSTNSTSSTT